MGKTRTNKGITQCRFYNTISNNFDSIDSALEFEAKRAVEKLFVEFQDFFAQHRFDIGISPEFTVKVTPLDTGPTYSQAFPAPINLKDGILVELALLHRYGIITS